MFRLTHSNNSSGGAGGKKTKQAWLEFREKLYDPSEPYPYKNNNRLRDYQVDGVNWLASTWYKKQGVRFRMNRQRFNILLGTTSHFFLSFLTLFFCSVFWQMKWDWGRYVISTPWVSFHGCNSHTQSISSNSDGPDSQLHRTHI